MVLFRPPWPKTPSPRSILRGFLRRVNSKGWPWPWLFSYAPDPWWGDMPQLDTSDQGRQARSRRPSRAVAGPTVPIFESWLADNKVHHVFFFLR